MLTRRSLLQFFFQLHSQNTIGFTDDHKYPRNFIFQKKKKLVKRYKIPGILTLIDFCARHTTISFRDASMLIICSQIPMNKYVFAVINILHIKYIAILQFNQRFVDELGYLLSIILAGINSTTFEFKPTVEPLHQNLPYP